MNRYDVVDDISAVLDRRVVVPTIVRCNRLEPRPRAADFALALRAEIRDALWMLARQWQVGEFRGDDTGSPVTAKLSYVSDPIVSVRGAGGAEVALDGSVPLEALVERRPVPVTIGEHLVSLDIRLLAGRQWVKRLRAAGLPTLADAFRTAYGIDPPDPDDPADYVVTAHATAWQTFAAVAGRAVDGLKLYLYLAADPTHRASDGLGLTGPEQDGVDALGPDFVTWFARLYLPPATPAEDCWVPDHLEYAAALTVDAPGGAATLLADEYHGGHLDWYSVDAAAAESEPPADADPPADGDPPADPPVVSGPRTVRSFLPTGARFDGMPDPRWWTFEEARTNFGDVQPETTDLAKLLLIEFGLVSGTDWFLAPVQAPVGTVIRVDGLAVTDVFGQRTWIQPAADGDEPWSGWSMFTTTDRRGGTAPGLVLIATTPTVMAGAPAESAQFVRDEVANLVWAVETAVRLPDGSSRRGREAATELHRRYQDALDGASTGDPASPPNDAAVHYRLMTAVGENWIPFVPVHVPGDVREIQLRRASMPRLLSGATGIPERVRPRTAIVRPGPDAAVPPPYVVHEEEISRAGELITCGWQRVRWSDGRICTWLGIDRRPGRGEASAGLAFDRASAT
ncbi:hypothetical protein GCM10023322_65350 [Rugosimonospora acidiphila]|uniref:Uncharacterized protein n=1 Tax=Rugosimonospora acidiphila TaxID=556531 RepID=A0ABP9SHG7_9ACTN